jgi:small conductance mechanosensitive channel
VAIVPLREPDSVDLRARLSADVTPLEVQELLDNAVETPVRDRPQITLEEIDGDAVVVRISATPERPSDGPKLASEVLEAVAGQTVRD